MTKNAILDQKNGQLREVVNCSYCVAIYYLATMKITKFNTNYDYIFEYMYILSELHN